MNKYLSYEKSKRLAELGYKPEQVIFWWNHENDDQSMYINPEYGLSIGPYDERDVLAIDCHDLLMELQKRDYELYPFFDEDTGNNEYIVKVCGEPLTPPEFYSDPNPVEALGAALIKLLEERQ